LVGLRAGPVHGSGAAGGLQSQLPPRLHLPCCSRSVGWSCRRARARPPLGCAVRRAARGARVPPLTQPERPRPPPQGSIWQSIQWLDELGMKTIEKVRASPGLVA
jgi:hypothetical protein